MDVVFLKVKIGLRPNGHADYPDWTTLPLAAAGADQAAKQALVDAQTLVKWRYDKVSGHAEETPDSPVGQQWGMLGVTQAFATEALAQWPTLVTQMTPAEAAAFWADRATAHLPSDRVDADYLNGLAAQRTLLVARGKPTTRIDTVIDRALNRDRPESGVRRNREKSFGDFIADRNLTVL